MKAKSTTETMLLWEVDAYFERHNLVIRPKSFGWQSDEKTGLETPHIWTRMKSHDKEKNK